MNTQKSKLTVLFLLFGMIYVMHTIPGLCVFDEQRSQQKRNIISIPDVKGYKVLKCDFHIHTVFSDGTVCQT